MLHLQPDAAKTMLTAISFAVRPVIRSSNERYVAVLITLALQLLWPVFTLILLLGTHAANRLSPGVRLAANAVVAGCFADAGAFGRQIDDPLEVSGRIGDAHGYASALLALAHDQQPAR